MALTQLKTGAIADDAVTTDKLANAINTERTANTAKVSLEDNAVTLAKMAGGTDGQIITYDASGDPVAVGPGTDGQVLTSTGAGSPPAFETLSVPAGTTINNNADNRVITGSGTANTLEGEANLTFTSDVLQVSSTTQGLGAKFINTGNEYTNLQFSAARTGADQALGIINAKWDNNHEVAAIYITAGNDTTNKDDGKLKFFTSAASGSIAERVRIDSDGLKFNGDTAAANALDDYEEGTWTPAVEGTYITSGTTTTYHVQTGTYTRIGRQVFINGYLQINAISYSTTNQVFEVTGLPFNGASSGGGAAGVTGSCVWQQLEWVGAAQSSYGTNNDVELAPTVSGYNKVRFRTASQDKYYIGELLNNAVDGNSATFIFSFWYLA